MNIAAAPKEKRNLVIIDEVQKLPIILDEVHRLIEEKGIKFVLTGSSARKLKRGAANLLAGRAWNTELYPLTYKEIPGFDLDRYLRFGGLPAVYLSELPEEELAAYARTYLYEEIQAEAIVRKLAQFSRFLKASALSHSQILNFAEIANDTAIPASTIREYYQILQDTLIGFLLEPWKGSKKRKAISTAKFYFFDTGVSNTLAGIQSLDRSSDLYGRCFETFIAMEIKAYLSYARKHLPLCFWRSTEKDEVDFIIGDSTAVEVKAAARVNERHLKGLRLLVEEKKMRNFFYVSHDPTELKFGEIHCVPWNRFLDLLWDGAII